MGDQAHPLRTGLLITDSSIEAEDLEISGASIAGLRIQGDSHPLVMANNFHCNVGPGVMVQGQSAPRFGTTASLKMAGSRRAPRAGIEIDNQAQPTLLHNEILHNGVPVSFPPALDEEIRSKNIVDAQPASSAQSHILRALHLKPARETERRCPQSNRSQKPKPHGNAQPFKPRSSENTKSSVS